MLSNIFSWLRINILKWSLFSHNIFILYKCNILDQNRCVYILPVSQIAFRAKQKLREKNRCFRAFVFYLYVLLHSLFMHQTHIHIPTFSRTERQHGAACHPHVISNEYIFLSLCGSLPVLGHNHLSFQEPFSYICCRETFHYPSWISFLRSGVSAPNRPAGDSHTQTHHRQPTHISAGESDRFKDGCSEAKLTGWHCYHVGQIIFVLCEGRRAHVDLLREPIKTCVNSL